MLGHLPLTCLSNKTTRSQYLLLCKAEMFVRLAPSSVHGVGVFALQNLPKNFNPCPMEVPVPHLAIRSETFASLPREVKSYARHYFEARGNGEERFYALPENGLHCMSAHYYVNHSNKPNLVCSAMHQADFRTLRPIEEGEELLLDYRRSFPGLYHLNFASKKRVRKMNKKHMSAEPLANSER